MLRKLNSSATVVVAVAGLLLVAAPPAAAQSGAFCQLSGTANITPGLSTTDGNFTFTFGGTLSGCASNDTSAPAQGAVSVGETIVVNGLTAQEPPATGSGSCASSNGAGTAITSWADGTTTVLSFTTQAATGAVNLQGNVVPSVTLPVVNPQPGQPTTVTVTTTRYAGDQAQGVVAFQADPQQCAGAGVTSAAVSGSVGVGKAQ